MMIGLGGQADGLQNVVHALVAVARENARKRGPDPAPGARRESHIVKHRGAFKDVRGLEFPADTQTGDPLLTQKADFAGCVLASLKNYAAFRGTNLAGDDI